MKTRRLQGYRNLPIRSKILLMFVPLFVLTITITGVFSYRIAATEILNKMKAVQNGVASQVTDHLNYIAQDAIDVSDYLFLTPEIQALLLSDKDSGNYIPQDAIQSISRMMVTRPYFQFLTLYSSHFAPIQFNNKGLSAAIPFEEYSESFHYYDILRNTNTASWSIEVPGVTKTIFQGDKMNKVLLTKVMKNSRTYSPEGVLILGIDEKDIRSAYELVSGDAQIAILNSDGIVMSENDGKWIGYPAEKLPYYKQDGEGSGIGKEIDDTKWVSTLISSELTGWQVLVVQPKKQLLEQLNRIQWITAIIVLVTIILSMFVSWAISGVITKPVLTILKSMKKFQLGNFSEKVPILGMDEVGQLGSGYNIMVQRVKGLIDDVYSVELKQKEAELKVLQSQINPHFLYNTLNTIAWTAQKNEDLQVAEMIYALSNIFKISLSEGKEFVTLKEEFALIGNYLFLQQMRFPNKLTYELEMDEVLSDFTLPKLLIQPLVENAVVHGIEPITGDIGFIHVRATLAEDKLVIEVTDDGVGIPQGRLRELNDKLASVSTSEQRISFALMNVSGRLRMVYGEQSSIEIQSTVGSGTRVLLSLPVRR
ncbi:sensor histidine kinase [Cohnella endophytica]|uniref:histidine kinase n=1 Tax=Cohnella endophytica TaxID=2419778 RepID=A0A494Y6X6_9BACL|nr:sensor histidine kinase [Cohnella endophytica]RKP57285.1 sensor histidine kinase [Cohnella endophytica]